MASRRNNVNPIIFTFCFHRYPINKYRVNICTVRVLDACWMLDACWKRSPGKEKVFGIPNYTSFEIQNPTRWIFVVKGNSNCFTQNRRYLNSSLKPAERIISLVNDNDITFCGMNLTYKAHYPKVGTHYCPCICRCCPIKMQKLLIVNSKSE